MTGGRGSRLIISQLTRKERESSASALAAAIPAAEVTEPVERRESGRRNRYAQVQVLEIPSFFFFFKKNHSKLN